MLYAPGLRTADEIRSVCGALSKPMNVLARPDLELAEIASAGARRVSVGGALTWVGVGAMAKAAARLRDGDLAVLRADVAIEEWLRPRG